MPKSFRRMLDAAYENSTLAEVLDASPSALQGVTDSDAQHLKDAFDITSIRKMAENRFFRNARALLSATGDPPFEPGPPNAWSDFFRSAPIDHYLNHPSGRFRTAFGPVYYRGRLNGTARVLGVGQDPSSDEILAQRVFVGHSGQLVQGFLAKLGITRSYVLLNAYLFSVFGQVDAELRTISLEDPVLPFRNEFLDRIAAENDIEVVIAFGVEARHALEHWPRRAQYTVVEVDHPAAFSAPANWNQSLGALSAALAADDGASFDLSHYGAEFATGDLRDIPRFDLPFGLPSWHGTGGGHSHRNGNERIVWDALP